MVGVLEAKKVASMSPWVVCNVMLMSDIRWWVGLGSGFPEFFQYPMIFCGDLFFDWALEIPGEDAPGVGFDFKMGACGGVFCTPEEGFCDVGMGGAEGVGGL